jgi:hypothetical protein
VSPWIAAALGAVALVEAVVIAALLLREPTVAPQVAEVPGSPIPVSAAAPLEAGFVPAAAEKPAPPAPDPIATAASRQRSGGVRFSAPFELKVLQGEKVLGSTADGPIILAAGTHQLDLINTAYGYSARRAVTFRPGDIARLDVTVPPQRLSVNAQPWAEVFIDGRSYGETPLANLSVAVGEHEVVFRHPELGERRVRVTVRADQPARVSTTFER